MTLKLWETIWLRQGEAEVGTWNQPCTKWMVFVAVSEQEGAIRQYGLVRRVTGFGVNAKSSNMHVGQVWRSHWQMVRYVIQSIKPSKHRVAMTMAVTGIGLARDCLYAYLNKFHRR